MTPEETRQAADVMLAHAEKKRIERWPIYGLDPIWTPDDDPIWDWASYKFRVAPERWSGKIWVHPDGRVIMHDEQDGEPITDGWRLIEAKEVGP